MRVLQGQPVIMELLADPSAQLTLLAPTNAGLAIEKLDDPAAVRPPLSLSSLAPLRGSCVFHARLNFLHTAPPGDPQLAPQLLLFSFKFFSS